MLIRPLPAPFLVMSHDQSGPMAKSRVKSLDTQEHGHWEVFHQGAEVTDYHHMFFSSVLFVRLGLLLSDSH